MINKRTTYAAATLAMAFAVATPGHAAAPDDEPAHKYGLATPRPRHPDAIRLASYNMLNLFDHVDDPALSGEHDDMKLAAAPARCRKLAEAIVAIDADIIALQEIESLDTVRWFRDTYLPDAGYDHIASEDVGYFRGIECSVMSRFPITGVKTWPGLSLDDVRREGPGWSDVPDEGLAFRRSPLMVEVRVSDDYRLTLFSVHHKSGRNWAWREAEALKIIELAGELQATDPARNVVIMGDFNAAPWDKSFRVYLEAGYVDAFAHRIIPRRRSERTDAESRLYKTHESNRVLDYVLLNGAAYREFVPGSPFVYGTLTPPDSYDWRKDPHPAGYASDHYPIVVDLIPRDRP